MSLKASAWDSVTEASIMGQAVQREDYMTLATVGAFLTLAGALVALASSKTRKTWGLLAVGGVIAAVGAIWAYSDIDTVHWLGVSVDRGSGLYLTLIGGVLGFTSAFLYRAK